MRFALYIHNHQPVGNFEEVMERAYATAYRPLLAALVNHPRVKFGIHNSGPLTEWLVKRHPEYIELLRDTVHRGQAEIIGSPFGEPILPFVPARDTIDQIRYFADMIHTQLDCEPKGIWLTERVWEPGLVSTLHDAGVQYTLLDDTHFHYAGLRDEDLHTYYITEDNGKVLRLFPISMRLRYLIPFHAVDEAIGYLKSEHEKNRSRLRCLGDDGEKFGVWPGTYQWVHEHGWLERFLSRLEQEEWIETVLLRDIANETPAGRVYLPTASYEEMNEWALPPDAAREYAALKKDVPNKYYYLIHGGYFRNFLSKYPEANLMHKRMLYVSRNIAGDEQARLALWRGQCSCAYWHGIFGGLYLPHLREAIYRSLIEAESHSVPSGVSIEDFDADGADEIIVSTQAFFVLIRPRTAGIIELDDRRRVANLANTLGRRVEVYHDRLPHEETQTGVRSIHEIIRSKDADLARHLVYDRHERGLALDHALERMPTAEEFYRDDLPGRPIAYTMSGVDHAGCSLRFETAAATGLSLRKTISIGSDIPGRITLAYGGTVPLLGIEFSLGLFSARTQLNGQIHTGDPMALPEAEQLVIQPERLPPITINSTMPFTTFVYSIDTVSSSESGFERISQGLALLLVTRGAPRLTIEP